MIYWRGDNPDPVLTMNPDLVTAIRRANADFNAYGHYADDAMTEAGDMRAVGVAREDTVRLCNMMVDEFGAELMEGGPEQAVALMAIIENVLATGVHLERARWEQP